MRNGRPGGFTYVGLLLFMAMAGIALTGTGTLASVRLQREKETQLLFAGEQFRQAIASYYRATPGPVKAYPKSLQDLLEDRRFPKPQRHLRRLYVDPVTGQAAWGLVELGGRIIGVHSLSARAPRKKAGFSEAQAEFAKARSYREWKFTYLDASPAAAVNGGR